SEPKPVEPINNKNSKRRVVFFFIWVSYEFTLVSSLLKIKGIKKGGENRDSPPQKINKKSLMTTFDQSTSQVLGL
uniref:hypothetical protein n=1 Tax=Algoriphagus sp. TaxID=1872435 RepID=UPI0040487571